MKNRVTAFLVLLLVSMVLAGPGPVPGPVPDTLHTVSNCTVVVDSTNRQIDRLCKSVSLFTSAAVYPTVTMGVSVPALEVNYGTGVVTALSSVDPFTIQFNLFQYKLIRDSEVHSFALWTPSAGLSVSKTDSGLGIGVSAIPFGIHIDAVAIGLGIRYTVVNKVTEPHRDNFSVVIPVTYSLF